ncbi:hypothetical protein [Scatolibacter rhodanostii]|uniref:hypothetical protein n=1 Tax=Scatolibacter rhodanostii TaxID=2014781 RepID=UPI000C08285C|nr:hypothetical protein [Scatolibacter rhodanostii]
MIQETILKNSLFGGYKKQDVLDYLDSILDENDKKTQHLEDELAFLRNENKLLQKRVLEKKEITSISVDEDNTTDSDKKTDLLEDGTILSEGVYEILPNHKIIALPNPLEFSTSKSLEIQNTAAQYPKDKGNHSTNETILEQPPIHKIENSAFEKENFEIERETLQKRIKELKEQLLTQEREKEKLQAKLEYSNDLLITIYQDHKTKML